MNRMQPGVRVGGQVKGAEDIVQNRNVINKDKQENIKNNWNM